MACLMIFFRTGILFEINEIDAMKNFIRAEKHLSVWVEFL